MILSWKVWQEDRQKDGDRRLQMCLQMFCRYFYCSSPGRPGWHFHACRRSLDHLWLEDSQYISYIARAHLSLAHSRYLKHTGEKTTYPKKIYEYMSMHWDKWPFAYTHKQTQLENENTWGGEGVARLQGLRREDAFEDCPEAALVPGIRHSASISDLTWGEGHKDRMMLSGHPGFSTILVPHSNISKSPLRISTIQHSMKQTVWIIHSIFLTFDCFQEKATLKKYFREQFEKKGMKNLMFGTWKYSAYCIPSSSAGQVHTTPCHSTWTTGIQKWVSRNRANKTKQAEVESQTWVELACTDTD